MKQNRVLTRAAFGDGYRKDSINEEIHRHREDHARAFKFDLAAICEDLRAWQRSRRLKAVRLPPKTMGPRKENRVRP
jgi:hypothetical protein